MSVLPSWLLAQIDDDERVARDAGGKVWHVDSDPMDDGERIEGDDITIYAEGGHNAYQADHIARWDPARVLAECDAKRRLIDGCMETLDHEDSHDYVLNGGTGEEYDLARFTLRMLALPYADRPGYLEEWRP